MPDRRISLASLIAAALLVTFGPGSALAMSAPETLGKVRAKIQIPPDLAKDDLIAAATEPVGEWLEGKDIKKTIVVPGRMVNFVAK